MRKVLKFNTLLVAGITSILLVGFQNCSKYQYAAVDVAGGSNNGLNTDTLPDNSSNDVNQTGGPSGSPPVIGSGGSTPVDGSGTGSGTTNPPVIGSGGSTTPSGDGTKPPVIGGGGSTTPSGDGTKPPVIGGGGSSPPVIKPPAASEEKECIDYAMGKKGNDDDDDSDDNDAKEKDDDSNENRSSGVKVSCSKGDKEKKEEKPVGVKCYINVDEDDDDEDLKSYCNKKYTSSKSSSKNRGVAELIISHRRGKLIITQDDIQHIKLIEDFRGKLVLCGVSVDKISNTRGKIVLVDSKVGQMLDHRGSIKIIGSSVSSNVSNSKTQINVDRTR